jgi:signal transduction histidine kinase
MKRSTAQRVGNLRPILLVAVVAGAGALGTVAVAVAVGMPASEVVHIATMLVPAIIATVVASSLAAPLLSRSKIRHQMLALGIVSAVVGLANLGVLTALMLVEHDAVLVASLLIYSTFAGIAVAWSLSASFSGGFTKLRSSASALAQGELHSRVGAIKGGPELEELAHSLDHMAARLEESLTRERRALAVRNDLITAVSHDLRTPLAGLRAMVEAIQDGVVEDPDTIRAYVAEMRRAVDSLVVLVDDLFELIQLDAGAIEAETERARLDEVVQSALAACRPSALEKRLILETALDGAEDSLVSPRMTRVLQNLVQNAIHHTPADGTVRVEARREPELLVVAVEDNGEGIERASLDRIFEPFWRGDPARSEAGSGLGLALAKRIVRSLGGEIDVQSEPHKGSRFAIVLPQT